MISKPKILFVYDIEDEKYWKDGLYASINELQKDFEITKWNYANFEKNGEAQYYLTNLTSDYDFVLGWGAFGSRVDNVLQLSNCKKKGLCLGGYAPYNGHEYNILFYEIPKWSKNWLEKQGYRGKIEHAFGINSDIFYKTEYHAPVIFNYITVGAFSTWKRQTRIIDKKGTRFAVGQIQKNNLPESLDIVGDLLLGGVAVSDMVTPHALAEYYRVSNTCFIPAEIMGGGERAILEARACGTGVEICDDNPKLQELLTCPIWSDKYFATQLKKGILETLNEN